MKEITPIRRETVHADQDWAGEAKGELLWVERIGEESHPRIDKVTYTTDGAVEYVLSVEGYGTTLWFFAEDFTPEEGLAFLDKEATDFMSRLQKMREQAVEDLAPRG